MKWLWIGLLVVLLAIATGAYVWNSGAPAIPPGTCPALLSAAPFDANAVGYADLTSLRSSELSSRMAAFEKTPQGAAYRDFVEKTNFHIDRDLDRILFTASADSQGGALILEGRFDQARIAAFAANIGSMRHYDSRDVYQFRTGNIASTASMTILGPNRLAFGMGPGADTQILMMADAAKGSEPELHDDLCARAERVAGAPFFVVGDVPKSATSEIASALAREDPDSAHILRALRGWDVAYWLDGDSVRIAVEGEFEGRYDALQARFGLGKLMDTLQRQEQTLKAGPLASDPAAPVLDALLKNLGVSVDGRYLRVETSLKKSDLEKLAAARTTVATN